MTRANGSGEVNHQWLVNALVEMVIQAPAIKISFKELREELRNEITFVALPDDEHRCYTQALTATTPKKLIENLQELAMGPKPRWPAVRGGWRTVELTTPSGQTHTASYWVETPQELCKSCTKTHPYQLCSPDSEGDCESFSGGMLT